MHTIGLNLSLILFFVNKPNANSPRIGPYVYPATVNIELTTLELLISLNVTITKNISVENIMCVIVFILRFLCLCMFMFNTSMQNDVVSDVRAESADEYAAAVIPRRKKILAVSPKWLRDRYAYISSDLLGSEM